jgi:hypothetical protein
MTRRRRPGSPLALLLARWPPAGPIECRGAATDDEADWPQGSSPARSRLTHRERGS